tara:strand:+ start:150 stop:461 length:312 start_codon:yes stop_codon:yes gene_type:complete
VDIVKEVNRLINIKEEVGANIVARAEPGKKDITWYIKWFSSITLIIAMLLNANNIFPLNLYISVIGLIGWLIVSLLWKDRSLIVLNTVAVAIYLNGIVQHLWG